MAILLPILTGLLYAASIYLLLRRSLVKLIIGLVFLGNATNLLLFSTSRLLARRAPIIEEGMTQASVDMTDPVPQALILTAIVISFAVLAFAVVLVGRAYKTLQTDDMDQLRSTDAV